MRKQFKRRCVFFLIFAHDNVPYRDFIFLYVKNVKVGMPMQSNRILLIYKSIKLKNYEKQYENISAVIACFRHEDDFLGAGQHAANSR